MIESLSAQPPLSSGPGRGPLKAKTRIRIPLGAQESTIVIKTRIPRRGFYSYSSGGTRINNCYQNEDPRKGILFILLWGHKNQQLLSKQGSPEEDSFVLLRGLNYQQLFSKRGSPEGDSIRIPPGAQLHITLFKMRIPGRGFYEYNAGEQITFFPSQSLRFT